MWPFRSTLNTSYITGLDMCEVCTEAVLSAESENDHKLRIVSGKKNASNVCYQAQNVGFWTEKSFKRVLPSTKCCQNSVNTSVCTPQCPHKHAAVCGTLANYWQCWDMQKASKGLSGNCWPLKSQKSLVGGWTNPFEKYWSKWIMSPNRDWT